MAIVVYRVLVKSSMRSAVELLAARMRQHIEFFVSIQFFASSSSQIMWSRIDGLSFTSIEILRCFRWQYIGRAAKQSEDQRAQP